MSWADQLPDTSYALAEWANRVTERLTLHYRDQDDLPNLAMSLNNQSVRLAELGRREEALQAITEAVQVYRRLADARPAARQRELEQSLRVLAWLREDVGEPDSTDG
jgi:tetratricopeptide (TPR) repeat protein